MGNKNILSQTCVKINNTYFDIVEGSFKIKKGYGSKDSVKTIGEGGKIVRNLVHKTEDKVATGTFSIVNTQENQDKIDALILNDNLTIEGIDVNGNYDPVTNASIMNDPEWAGSSDGVEIQFEGDSTVRA
jgi:hypothetical protein